MSVKVYTLHLLDGYFLEQDMGGDLGKNIIMAVPKSDYDKLEARCKELQDDLLRLQDEVMFNEKYSLDEHNKVYNQIITGARQHYNKYNSRAGGQMVTIADSFEYHVMAVAREYERNKLESENRILKAKLEKCKEQRNIEINTGLLLIEWKFKNEEERLKEYAKECANYDQELDSIE